MPVRSLPDHPHLDHLRNQAKALLNHWQAGDAESLATIAEFHPGNPEPALSAAQLVIARSYGVPSWPKLRQHLDLLTSFSRSPHLPPSETEHPADTFIRLSCLNYGNDDPAHRQRAQAMLSDDPTLAKASIFTMTITGSVSAIQDVLADDPTAARRPGGPFAWEPLLYLAYGRLESAPGSGSATAIARLLLVHGADANAGYLWAGLPSPFTVLTGVFGGGEGGNSQPPHTEVDTLAPLLLAAGANANDNQALYNRQFTPQNDHLHRLFGHGLGQGDGGPWKHRLGTALASPMQMVEDQLLSAASQNFIERVQLLIEHGVDPDGRGTAHPIYQGRSAIELAQSRGNQEIVELLRAAGATSVVETAAEALLIALLAGDAQRAMFLAADKSLCTQVIREHPDAITTAVQMRRPEAVRLLMEYGFPVEGSGDASPLHQAAWNGDLAMVQLLLAYGANPSRRDRTHQGTPLDWARHNQQSAVIELLESPAHRDE